jgi:hypothetical protein
VTVPLASSAPVDGTVYSTAPPEATGTALRVGDDAANDPAKGLLRFPLGAIPPGAQVRAARLRVHQSAVVGAPFASLGAVKVEWVDAGPGLDAADHVSAPLSPFVATISQDPAIGPREVDVTIPVIQAHLALRTDIDLRLFFDVPTNGDGLTDRVEFNDAEDLFAAPGTVPELEVVYTP